MEYIMVTWIVNSFTADTNKLFLALFVLAERFLNGSGGLPEIFKAFW